MYVLAITWVATVENFAQQLFAGKPEIVTFEKSVYKGGTQNWDMCTGYHNQLLVANNDGLLVFDGQQWRAFPLPNKTITRSVVYDADSKKIFVGGQDEVGYFYPDDKGKLAFTSIKESIPETYRTLEDVWDIKIYQGRLAFRSVNRIYIFDGTNWKIHSKPVINFMSVVSDGFVFNDLFEGIFKVSGGQPVKIPGSELFRYKAIIDMIEVDRNHWIVLTEKDGMYVFQNGKWNELLSEESAFLKKNRVHAVCSMGDSMFVVGTHLGGLMVMNQNAEAVYILNKEKGLQNNTVSSLVTDINQHLWVGTYHGINYVKINSDFSSFIPDGKQEGAVYASVIYQDVLYCGTNNGLYYRSVSHRDNPFLPGDFALVPGSEGQVWGLDVVRGDLIMSHNEGAFQVTGTQLLRLSDLPGAWKFLEWDNEGTIIGGFYTGVYFFKKIYEKWTQTGKIDGFNESSRIMVRDGNHLWVSHPYRGLFRISDADRKTSNIKLYGPENGLPTKYRNHVFGMDNHILVAAEYGLFRYHAQKDHFEPMEDFASYFGKRTRFRKLHLHQDKIWFVTDESTGYLKVEDNILSKNFQKTILPGITEKLVAGFENFYCLEDDVLFFTNKGIQYFHPKKNQIKKFKAYISGIHSVTADSFVFYGFHMNKGLIEEKQQQIQGFSADENAFTFYFTSDLAHEGVQFRFYLEPEEKNWSEWTNKNFKEYNHLPPGKHTFYLMAKDLAGNESEVSTFIFEIYPPWYRSFWAKMIYAVLLGMILWYFRFRLVRKYESKTNELEAQKKESDEKVQQLLNEKLEAEIIYKNKELGLSTMHLLQKNETLGKLRLELEKVKKNIRDPHAKQEIKNLMSILSDDERLEEDWEGFSQNFDLVHNDFLKRVKQKHPGLTPKDLKLCAYLKMNLSTKELAPLLNISIRGVEISRYRLRKKLGIPNDVNLNDYMMGF